MDCQSDKANSSTHTRTETNSAEEAQRLCSALTPELLLQNSAVMSSPFHLSAESLRLWRGEVHPTAAGQSTARKERKAAVRSSSPEEPEFQGLQVKPGPPR